MVKIHVARSLATLERIYSMRIAVADGEPEDAEELDRVRTFGSACRAGFDERKRALHDVVAGTIVMQVEEQHALQAADTLA